MNEFIKNQNHHEIAGGKESEIKGLMKESKEGQEGLKQMIRFFDVAKYSTNDISFIDFDNVAKKVDKYGNTTIYMMEKRGNKNIYYSLTYYESINKFCSGLMEGGEYIGIEIERGRLKQLPQKFLESNEVEEILRKFEKKVKKQKDYEIMVQKILGKL